MTDELDEGLPHRLPHHRVGCHDVGDGEERKKDAYADDFQGLQDHIFSAEAGQPLVPDGGQQLLDVGMCYELQQKDTMAYSCSPILYDELYVSSPPNKKGSRLYLKDLEKIVRLSHSCMAFLRKNMSYKILQRVRVIF